MWAQAPAWSCCLTPAPIKWQLLLLRLLLRVAAGMVAWGGVELAALEVVVVVVVEGRRRTPWLPCWLQGWIQPNWLLLAW
jgi:hypothetical protein